jgi:hypothetical protein
MPIAVLGLESAMIAPPAGAGAARVTTPCELWPSSTLGGPSVNEEIVGAVGARIVTATCRELLPTLAVIVATVLVVTAFV